jgi:hypothetical protein
MVWDGKLIGGGTVGGLLVTSLNGLGIDIGKSGFILDYFNPPALAAQVELHPDSLVVTARNTGRGAASLTVDRLVVTLDAADPDEAPELFVDKWDAGQIRWGDPAPGGASLLEQDKGTLTFVGTSDYEPDLESEEFFTPSVGKCTFSLTMRFNGEPVSVEDCPCGSEGSCSVR